MPFTEPRPYQIKRDPFARETFERVSYRENHACRWCGRRVTPNFYYRWTPDSGHNTPDYLGPFCCVGCYRDYTDDHR